MDKNKVNTVRAKVFKSKVIEKANASTNNDKDSRVVERIAHPNNVEFLLNFRNYSTMLGQSINALSMNVIGRGYYLQYKGNEKENAAMKAEWDFVQALLEDFGVDELSLTQVLKTAYEHELSTGNGYIEVIRDLAGRAVEVDFVSPTYMYLMPKGPAIQITTKAGITKHRKFRKFLQDIAGDKVYFKEYGDPRQMDRRTGKYVEGLPEEYQANEIIHLKDVDNGESYGQTRWMGHLLHMQAARKAEELNYRYFINGKHTPTMITITGGQLSEESELALTDYMNSISNENVQHQMLLLEIDKVIDMADIDGKTQRPEIKIEKLTVMEDGLFQDMIKNSDDKVQSAFGLPDLYVGKTREINRATAETTLEHAENNIFAGEREVFEEIINKVLLAGYELKYVEVKFNKQPEYSNPESMLATLEAAGATGAITKNELREEFGNILGKEFEPFPEPEADLSLNVNQVEPQPMQEDVLQKNWLKDTRDSLVEISSKLVDDQDEEY